MDVGIYVTAQMTGHPFPLVDFPRAGALLLQRLSYLILATFRSYLSRSRFRLTCCLMRSPLACVIALCTVLSTSLEQLSTPRCEMSPVNCCKFMPLQWIPAVGVVLDLHGVFMGPSQPYQTGIVDFPHLLPLMEYTMNMLYRGSPAYCPAACGVVLVLQP